MRRRGCINSSSWLVKTRAQSGATVVHFRHSGSRQIPFRGVQAANVPSFHRRQRRQSSLPLSQLFRPEIMLEYNLNAFFFFFYSTYCRHNRQASCSEGEMNATDRHPSLRRISIATCNVYSLTSDWDLRCGSADACKPSSRAMVRSCLSDRIVAQWPGGLISTGT